MRHKQNIAITATFTAEPVEESLAFWTSELDIPGKIEFAPYNQVFQQLLDPSSLLANNQDGVNVILVRFEDWDRDGVRLLPSVTPSEQERILAEQARYILPNRMEIAHLNQYETEALYQQIFVDQVYLRHGIVLNDGDCVFDVGANIGLFTLLMRQKYKDASIYAFEPAPNAFETLQSNVALYCENASLFNCGLADEDKEAPFTYYPRSSIFSSYHADRAQDEKMVRSVILNLLQKDSSAEQKVLETLADELLKGRLESETLMVRLRTLSSVIREHGIKRIDLLKIDVEKSELAVLKGIEDDDWAKIRQIVVEVDDREGSGIKEVKRLLMEKGFTVTVEQDDLLQGSGLYHVYATPPTPESKESRTKPTLDAVKIEENLHDFGLALKKAIKHSATPHLVYVCPDSPAVAAHADRRVFYQQMENLLASELDGISGLYLIKTSELTTIYPVPTYYDPFGDELGHVPFTPAFFSALGTHIARKIYTIQSPAHKVIVLDCDGTLWKGVCGEDGALGIEIDSPRKQLQEFIVAQHDAGLLICLCSKNNEEDVVEVFERRPEMPLKRDHIVSWRVNWRPKSENIKSLADQLQLGLEDFIFIDDDPVECAQVQANYPEILTLQLPGQGEDIPRFLKHIWAFDHLKITEEDKKRTSLYRQDIERELVRVESLNLGEFLASLDLEVKISQLQTQHHPRVSQLTQRTNQFNFTTLRRSEGEIQKLCKSGQLECLVVEVSDRFGDYGLVGAIMFQEDQFNAIKVDTLLLSCRSLGRGVEHRMIAKLGEIGEERGLDFVEVTYRPTKKNQPALDFLDDVGGKFKRSSGGSFIFKFTVEFAASITYSPDIAGSESKTRALPVSASSDRDPTFERETKSALMSRIAMELYEAEQILKAIQPQKHQDRPDLEIALVEPRTSNEEVLTRIWTQILGLDQVGINDHFLELGGNSLQAIQIISQVLNTFQVELAMGSFLESPTVADMAMIITQNQAEIKSHRNIGNVLTELEDLSDEEAESLLDNEE